MLHLSRRTSRSSQENLKKNNNNNKFGKPKATVRRTVLKSSTEVKSCSAGVITGNSKLVAKPKKTSQSDQNFDNKSIPRKFLFDYCKNCGDIVNRDSAFRIDDDNIQTAVEIQREKDDKEKKQHFKSNQSVASSSNTASSSSTKSTFKNKKSASTITNKLKLNIPKTESKEKPKSSNSGILHGNNVKRYNKNNNCETISISDKESKKVLKNVPILDPIKEIPESTSFVSSANVYHVNSLHREAPLLNMDDDDNLIQLKEFRKNNYFECHSTNSRLNSKASVTYLGPDHKCVYRFFLNDRLFPEPLNVDYNNTIRCTECNLPLNLEESKDGDVKVNGTIQAKVKLSSEKDVKDIFVILPVKEPLIIKERRKENTPKEEEIVYFGVVRLDYYGNSLFNQILPADSLALKYQKGYKEKGKLRKDYRYKEEDECEVIIV